MTTEKAELRQRMRTARSRLSPPERSRASADACTLLFNDARFQRARVLTVFAAINEEADPTELARAARSNGQRVLYPRLERGTIVFAEAEPEALVATGKMAIPEPPPAMPAVSLAQIDLYVVPGLAFDTAGGRMGYGRGHYDRLLTEARAARPDAILVGFAFSAQLVPRVPREAHDVALDGVATEKGVIWAPGAAIFDRR